MALNVSYPVVDRRFQQSRPIVVIELNRCQWGLQGNGITGRNRLETFLHACCDPAQMMFLRTILCNRAAVLTRVLDSLQRRRRRTQSLSRLRTFQGCIALHQYVTALIRDRICEESHRIDGNC
jgi:hypothetical protein